MMNALKNAVKTSVFRSWTRDEGATAAIEAGFLFPILVAILCGMIDTGVALVTNQKVVDSSQMIADLLTRNTSVNNADIADAVVAAHLAIQPYSISSYGIDIMGVQYLTVARTPTERWRTTINMTPNPDLLTHSAGLGDENDGVVAVTAHFTHTPYFSFFLIGDIVMNEESFARGRKGLYVSKV
ncbi:MAG: TadE/TadG family type IV pilus assembly protein [Alphaproteobacteria bacterium]